MRTDLLKALIDQFKERHQRPPEEIRVHPLALAALAVKGELCAKFENIPVRCLEVAPSRKSSTRILGIGVYKKALRGFDL